MSIIQLYQDVKKENEQLKKQNMQLKEKIRSLSNGHWRNNGNKGERIIAQMLGGEITPPNSRYDVILPNGLKLEVKYAGLSFPNFKKAQTRVWKWTDLKGSDGNKIYDSLILVDESDKKYKYLHSDPDADYLFFDIPFEDVDNLPDKSEKVTLSTNPNTVRSKVNISLFEMYQKTEDQLREKYNISSLKSGDSL